MEQYSLEGSGNRIICQPAGSICELVLVQVVGRETLRVGTHQAVGRLPLVGPSVSVGSLANECKRRETEVTKVNNNIVKRT